VAMTTRCPDTSPIPYVKPPSSFLFGFLPAGLVFDIQPPQGYARVAGLVPFPMNAINIIFLVG